MRSTSNGSCMLVISSYELSTSSCLRRVVVPRFSPEQAIIWMDFDENLRMSAICSPNCRRLS